MRELQAQNGEDETLPAAQDVLDQEELLNAAADFIDRYESVFENLSHWYSFEKEIPPVNTTSP